MMVVSRGAPGKLLVLMCEGVGRLQPDSSRESVVKRELTEERVRRTNGRLLPSQGALQTRHRL